MTIPQVVDGVTDADAAFMNQLVDAANQANAAFNGAGQITTAAITPALEGYGPLANMRAGRANIMDYNDHAGDGSTSINSLVSEMIADTTTDDVLEFPPGAYLLTGQWTLSVPRRVLFHPGATVVLANGANNHMIRVSAPGCHIIGGTLDANGANQSYDGNGVFIGHRDAVDCVIDGLTILNPKYMGVRSQAAGTKVRHVTVTNSGYIGILIKTDNTYSVADQADSEVLFCTVDRSSLPTSLAGGGIQVYGHTAAGLQTIGTKVIGNTVRLPLNPISHDCQPIETHDLAPGSLISGNHTYGGAIGISCNQSDGSAVVGNVVTDAGVYGIECADTNKMTITGNTITGASAEQGVSASSVTDTESMLTVMGNIISGFDIGVHIQKQVRTIVSGNVAEVAPGGAGVKIQQSERATVFGNDLAGSGSGSKGLWIDRSSKVQAYGNAIDGFYDAIQLLGFGGYTFVDSRIGPNTLRNYTRRIYQALSGGSTVDPSFVLMDDIPTITGSRGSNVALADLLTKMAARGQLVDGTS
jgi:nitrous oxidase accessory protein NosD